jgi:hypothetical protein
LKVTLNRLDCVWSDSEFVVLYWYVASRYERRRGVTYQRTVGWMMREVLGRWLSEYEKLNWSWPSGKGAQLAE